MSKNKRILNLHELKFAELAVFHENTTMFQANTNASLKNLETQVGKLALAMPKQSRDSFPSDTKKNPKDYMAITLRSGKELKGSREAEKKQIDKKLEVKIKIHQTCKKNQSINGLSDENE